MAVLMEIFARPEACRFPLRGTMLGGLINRGHRLSVTRMSEFLYLVILERHSAHRRKRFAG